MMTMDGAFGPTRVMPPAADNYLRPPALLSVEVDEGDDIEWIWTHYADGRSAVTGYRIVPKLPRAPRQRNVPGDSPLSR